jgi:hypothetical protein
MLPREIQHFLISLGYDPGAEDGIVGAKTRHAVRRFQLDRGLLPDGIPGSRTEAAILAAIRESNAERALQLRRPAFPPRPANPVVTAALIAELSLRERDLTRLNLVGVRSWQDGQSVANRLNEYDDTIYVVEGNVATGCRASVDPGRLREPNPKGIAHLIPGLYLYRIGLHRRRETALVQAAPVRIRRFFDENHLPESAEHGTDEIEEGWFGINIHRGGMGTRVGEWSSGCQVVHGSQWTAFLQIVLSAASRGQRRFPYLLIEGKHLVERTREATADHSSEGSAPGVDSPKPPPL